MKALQAAIAASVESYRGWSSELVVFGTDDPIDVSERVLSRLADAGVGPPLELLFYAASTGVVCGLRTAAGDVVIKCHAPLHSPEFIDAIFGAQSRLFAAGLPVAEPLTVVHGERLSASVERYLPSTGHGPLGANALRSSATMAAAIVENCAPLDAATLFNPTERVAGEPYPPVLHPVIDLSSSRETDWIDELALMAVDRVEFVDECVVAHGDFTARNVCFTNGTITAIYDLDALSALPEWFALGFTALMWRRRGTATETLPDLAELHRYGTYYAEGRGVILDERRWKLMLRGALWAGAYGTRRELSIAHHTGREVDTFVRWLREQVAAGKDLLSTPIPA